ncbi:MAG: polyprenyl synthetase family protein [Candidatus Binataceae bacterium]|nr:polyprenyl synthetase family protein [Candidatus Binataceae bacterium]
MQNLKSARAGTFRLENSSNELDPSDLQPASSFEFDAYLKSRVRLIEQALEPCAIQTGGPGERLSEAMRYSLLSGGKRLRPILALGACEAVGGRIENAMGLACAIEMIHTYSMIHDDLPCMDNDDLRRGKPTNHRVYGEAIATLAGDALLTDAFGIVARNTPAGVSRIALVETIAELSSAAGSAGMVGGQTIDLMDEGRSVSIEDLEYLHSRKTGALFVAAVMGGGRLGGGNAAQLAALGAYARAIGLAFQVIDDLLDVEGSTEQMGKRTQKDHQRGKVTYPSLLGVEASREFAEALRLKAGEALSEFDYHAEPLRRLANFAVERNS